MTKTTKTKKNASGHVSQMQFREDVLRQRALELSNGHSPHIATSDAIVADAENFLKFLRGSN